MKILVAADISPTAVQICEFLQNYLKPHTTDIPEVTILHVYEPELDYTEEAPTKNRQAVPTSEHELRHIFQPLATTCKLEYVVVNQALGDTILKYAAKVDLVVMGRRRRGQMLEMMTGSLSQFVLHRASCPVLIVPEPTTRQLAYKMLQMEAAQPTIMLPESLARLKVLIGVAQADGNIDLQERLWLESNVQQAKFPAGIVWETLLTEPVNLAQELGQITDPVQQELTYYAAYLLANTDGKYHPTEQQAIDLIAATFNLTSEKVEQLQELVNRVANFQNIAKGESISDPTQRSTIIEEKILRYAMATAVLGADPSPLSGSYTQSAALGLQMILIAEIADIYGAVDFAVKPFFEEMVGSLGLVSAWLMALDLTKLVPKVGASLGAADAFTATWAMGQTTVVYFEAAYSQPEVRLDSISLRQLFKQNRKSAEAIYDLHELTIESQKRENATQIKLLTEAVKTGKMPTDSYQKRLQQLLLTIQHPQLNLL
ncbi:DUF533 domain-containing protein [Chamaesiphon sp. VAR_48_metabat_135_sub]|uniref:DUF533 domain-containing protein n=1 Tax=Chamaesiphon sp. VAR_48_metabat_135_sub TaxID=2964699 RepID=UPI00286A486C|nr:DUF533 domain-containing protein [Chamaesiphon sp. VAR_48_metabat_135_sub]